MIPPEPEPTFKHYTASSTRTIAIGDTTGVVYDLVQDNGVSCSLKIEAAEVQSDLTTLIINEVPNFEQVNYYFCNSNLTRCVLASNSQMGVTGVMYTYQSGTGTMKQTSIPCELLSCTPSDYYDSVKSGNFDIEVSQ